MTSEMETLHWRDISWAIRRLPRAVRLALESRPSRTFIAGGFIRCAITNESVNDIDILVASEEDAHALVNELAAGKRVYKTANASTIDFRPPVQVIHRWTFDTPYQAVESFDFTIAKAAIWFNGDKWIGICDPTYYADLAAKRLIYTSPARNEDAGGSMLRVLKFYQRGYRIPLDSLGAVIARLCNGVRDIGEHGEEDLARLLTGLLVEVDPLLDLEHVAHLATKEPEVQGDTSNP